jgi:hypothetical protein
LGVFSTAVTKTPKLSPGRGVVSGRFGIFTRPARRRRWWHDLPGERALAGDHDELPVAAAADFEELVVCFLENA